MKQMYLPMGNMRRLAIIWCGITKSGRTNIRIMKISKIGARNNERSKQI